MEELTPKRIVEELDKYIIGQDDAKRSVAIALRNRYRRSKLPRELQEEILPKNILMVGPTGVGKTEIAKRIAKLVNAPFIKVEATKFTEIGYVGRDVESMIRDLVEESIRMVKTEKINEVKDKAVYLAEECILDILMPKKQKSSAYNNPFDFIFNTRDDAEEQQSDEYEDDSYELMNKRAEILKKLKNREMEDFYIDIEVEEKNYSTIEMIGLGNEEMNVNVQDMFGGIFPKKKKTRKVTIEAARRIFEQEEAQKLIDMDEVADEALKRAGENGIIFIDEIDKIAGKNYSSGPDVSREGVQRDILPIVEGSTVITKYGPIKTDHILFIAAGAFHISKITDLIPELQGRFPVKVELKNLTKDDFKKILIQPKNAIIKQYCMLMETENVRLIFDDTSIEELAATAFLINEQTENIGARRLYTILEKLLEDISFNASEYDDKTFTIDGYYVKNALSGIIRNKDLSKFII
ncbi:ATP-dependent protease ATPase subunit ClpY [Oxobacter pfennigii]|uniref:ATP-dependent protease ATPase subunit HslU n=1 Tax=Oxobacter pfennigii TaxID=36849 RepID=A0A0N8NT59_9CLOT|nr:ATP-dependent protease ATPase subunit HslU [Oxobacter pfennigii]KPU43920.1 ATP-dependent protease ATPase subunit ClpY [Oxobacter pfennigii]